MNLQDDFKATGIALYLCFPYDIWCWILMYQVELYNHYVLHELKPWKRKPTIKLMFHVFREIYDVMTVIRAVTAGRYLMETTSEFVASIFVMTKQRFSYPLLVYFC